MENETQTIPKRELKLNVKLSKISSTRQSSSKACFIRRISVASNAIQTIDNEA
jgi:hypothetical protein